MDGGCKLHIEQDSILHLLLNTLEHHVGPREIRQPAGILRESDSTTANDLDIWATHVVSQSTSA